MDLRNYNLEEQEIQELRQLAKEKGWIILLRLLDSLAINVTKSLINSSGDEEKKRAEIQAYKKLHTILTNLYSEVKDGDRSTGTGTNRKPAGYPY